MTITRIYQMHHALFDIMCTQKSKPDAHVHPAVVLTNVKVEILVLYPMIWGYTYSLLIFPPCQKQNCSIFMQRVPTPSLKSHQFINSINHNLQCLPSGNSPWKPPSSLPNSSVRSAYRKHWATSLWKSIYRTQRNLWEHHGTQSVPGREWRSATCNQNKIREDDQKDLVNQN